MAEIETMKLAEKMMKIRELAGVVTKDKKGFNYKYSDVTKVLANVTGGMQKYHVKLTPHVVPGTSCVQLVTTTNTKFDKTGKPYDQTATEMLYTADMIWTWQNIDDPEDIEEVPWFITGAQADPSQAFGSALTYCTRQFLKGYFQIAEVEDDPDTYRSRQKEAQARADKEVAAEIIHKFDTILRGYLSDHPDKNEDAKKFTSRFAKNGNYLNITDPALAAKLLSDFEETFLNKKE